MSMISGTHLSRSPRHSQSQIPLSQDAYSTDDPLRRVPSFTGSLLSSDDQSDHPSLSSVQRPTEDILKNIPHRGDTEYTLGVFCTETHRSEEAGAATVTRLLRYGTTGRVAHRFLLLEVMKRDIKLWIRLDRRPRSGNLLKISSSYLAANDLVKMTMVLQNLLGSKVRREAVIEFSSPIPLKRLVRVLDIIRDESTAYTLSRENAWFFASIIQEISVQFLGGRFIEVGRLNNPSLASGRRRAIKETLYKMIPTGVRTLVTEIESMAVTTHDEPLIRAIFRLMQVVGVQDKLLLCSSLDEATRRHGRQSSLIRLLSECKMALYEHLHRLSAVPGARGFRSGFSSDLTDRLNIWVSSVGGNHRVSERILDQSQMDKLDTEITNIFSEAFEQETMRTEARIGAAPQWMGHTCSNSTDRTLALWTLQHLSHCKSLLAHFEEHRHRLKEDISNLQALFASAVPAKAMFACKSWILLVCRVSPKDPGIVGALEQVVYQWLLYWIVAMGVMDEIDAACRGLHQLEQWMRGHDKVGDIRLRVLEMYRFVLRSKRALIQCPFPVFATSPSMDLNSSAFPSTSLYNAIVITSPENTQESWSRTVLKFRHPRPVCSLAYSSDGTYLASAFRDRCIWLWNANTGAKASEVRLPFDCIYVAFFPDTLQVACGCEDGSIYICNADGSGVPKRLSGHSKCVNCIAFTSYGTRLASASGDKTIRIWDAVGGKGIHTLKGHTDVVVSVEYARSRTVLASASYDGTVRVWDVASRKQFYRFDVFIHTFCLALHPDDERVIVACKDGLVRIVNIFDGDAVPLQSHTDAVYSVSCSEDGKWIASASADSSISLWHADGTTWTHARTIGDHTGKVYAVAFSPSGTRLASGSHDCSVRIWDAEARVERRNKGDLFAIASNARFTASVDGGKALWLTDSSDPNASPILLRGHIDSVTCACFSRNGLHLASASWDLSVRIWDIDTGQCTKRVGLAARNFQLNQSGFLAPYHMSYSKDGSVLRVRGWKVSNDSGRPYTIDLDTGTWKQLSTSCSDDSFTATYQPDPTLPIVLDRNCLCTRLANGFAYLCWLPDDFEPISEVIQSGRRASVGGRGGEVAYANFDGVSVPA